MFSQFKSRISYYYEQKYLKSATKQPLTFFLRRTIPFNLKAKNIYFERYRNRNRIDNNGESIEDYIVNNVNSAALAGLLSGFKGRKTLCVVFT